MPLVLAQKGAVSTTHHDSQAFSESIFAFSPFLV